jgi:ribosomal-protein-alanine N-acetyltransferase
VIVRAAKPVDTLSIVQIERSVSQHPWSLSQILSICRSEQEHVWVLESGTREVVGFAVSQLAAGDAGLLNIAVLPDYQGRQYGSALLQAVLGAARKAGAARCLLEVRCSNGGAIALYRKYGFDSDGVRKNYYPTDIGREDAVLMSLNLQPLTV